MEATLACSDRPIEQRAPGGTGVAHTRHHGRIHLFVHPRSAAHDGRLDFGQLLRDVIHAPGDPDLTAVDDGEEDLIDPPEHMGVRKPRQRPVLVVDGMYLDRRAADVDEVTVRQLDALRVARRPRRVDDRAQVVGSDRRHAPADLTILCGSVTDPFRDLCRHQSDVFEGHLRRRRGIGRNRERRARVVDDLLDDLRCRAGVDRNRDRSSCLDAEVAPKPVQAVLSDQDHAVPYLDPGVDQPGCDREDVAAHRVPTRGLPDAVLQMMGESAVAVFHRLPKEDAERSPLRDRLGIDLLGAGGGRSP